MEGAAVAAAEGATLLGVGGVLAPVVAPVAIGAWAAQGMVHAIKHRRDGVEIPNARYM